MGRIRGLFAENDRLAWLGGVRLFISAADRAAD